MEKEIENPFSEGQLVVCIREEFPWIKAYGGTGPAPLTPVKNEQLTVDEVLGDFVRFDKYDTDESFNWWKYDRFAPVQEIGAVATFDLLRELIGPYIDRERLEEYMLEE